MSECPDWRASLLCLSLDRSCVAWRLFAWRRNSWHAVGLQYYGEILSKKPVELHRFYTDESTFCHASGTKEEVSERPPSPGHDIHLYLNIYGVKYDTNSLARVVLSP